MFQTHRPRGHIWTHASQFQQTDNFRDIDLEECTVSDPSEPVVTDGNENVSARAQVIKRKRIQSLANDLLNGNPLFISSARPSPESLRSTVLRNTDHANKYKSAPKEDIHKRPPLTSITADWEDVEDDDEVLKRLLRRKPVSKQHVTAKSKSVKKDSRAHRPAERVKAQAKCRPARRSRAIQVMTGPGTEALTQAAALRMRKKLSPINEVVHLASLDAAFPTCSSPEHGTDLQPRAHNNSETGQANRWLSRRQSRFSFSKYQPDDESQGESRLTSAATPQGSSDEPNSTVVDMGRGEIDQPGENNSSNNTSGFQASYQTAHDRPDAVYEVSDRLDARSPPDVSEMEDRTRHLPAEIASHPASHPSLPPKASRSKPGETGSNADSRHPSPYITAPSSQNNSTPFMFRKRHSGSPANIMDQSGTLSGESNEPQKRLLHPLRNSISMADNLLLAPSDTGSLVEKPPREAFHTSGVAGLGKKGAPVPEDDRLRKTVITSPGSDEPSGAMSKVSNVSITCNSAPETSSKSPKGDVVASVVTQGQASALSQAWAGTQFLLDQAQRDLFQSPEKQSMAHDERLPQTPAQDAERPRSRLSSSRCEPLAQLSQEPLPSTQQLLGDFEGWSTVKKPRAGVRPSLLPGSRLEDHGVDLDKDTPKVARLSSSAPYSHRNTGRVAEEMSQRGGPISSTAPTPAPASIAVNDDINSGRKQHNVNRSQIHTSAFGSHDGGISTSILGTNSFSNTEALGAALDEDSIDHTSARRMSSFEAVQQYSQLPQEASNLSETIDDLRDLLDLSEMQGLMSQVG